MLDHSEQWRYHRGGAPSSGEGSGADHLIEDMHGRSQRMLSDFLQHVV